MIEPPIRMEAAKSAENIESLWYPNVLLVSGDLRAPRSKSHETSKAMLSPKSCNASERIAKLLVQKPPTISKTVKATFKNAAKRTLSSRSGIIKLDSRLDKNLSKNKQKGINGDMRGSAH